MPIIPKPIDPRNQQALVKQVRELVLDYCPEWKKDMSSLENDRQADALIQIFSRMMEIVIQRLNKVPDKNFLSFLDLIGVRQLPPRIARAPLTFTMAKGARLYGSIPAGTQVAAEGDVVFETEKELTVILPKLVEAISLSPDDDKWTDHTPVLIDKKEEGIESIFEGKTLITHRIYLGHEKLFGLKESATITLKVRLKATVEPKVLWDVKWYCYKDEKSSDLISLVPDINDNVAKILKSGDITFSGISGISKRTLTGFEKETGQKKSWTNNWIFAELKTAIPRDNLPEIDTIKAMIVVKSASSSGTGTISSSGTEITGSGTAFTKELKAGDIIISDNQTKIVTAVASDTSLTIGSAFSSALAGKNFTYVSPPKPDLAFFNNFPLDMTKDFYPFGDKPKFNDTFYIGSQEVFSKEKANITINIALSRGLKKPDTKDIVIYWEFWDGKNWIKIGETDENGVSVKQGNYEFMDSTKAFKDNGQVTFICPKIEARKMYGEEEKNYWIRVRIADGNYGEEAKYESIVVKDGTGTISSKGTAVTGRGTAFKSELDKCDSIIANGQTRSITDITSDSSLTIKSAFSSDLPSESKFTYSSDKTTGTEGADNTLWVYKPPTFMPPSISALTLKYDFNTTPENLDVVLTYNDFTYQDQTEVCKKEKQYFTPFQPVEDKVPALYLAFDQSLESNLPVAIFFPLLEKVFSSCQEASNQETQQNALVVWEYWTGKKWYELKVEDNTKNLTEREMIQFNAPADLTKKSCFEAENCWIRARLEKGKYYPRLGAIYTNTVWAYNTVTVQDEILGSSNGKPGQVFKLSRSSVLPEQKVLVKEISLTEEERNTIEIEKEEKDDAGNITGFWVCWVEKKHFYSSEPYSRHYIIDRNRGEITFGDGERGMIPLAGKNNIKCSYKSGGGAKGNVQAKEITKLRKSFPYIDSVTNPEAADGGGDMEEFESIMERGPQTLKHQDRAVTYEDFKWLTMEASPKVARVRCLPTSDTSLQFKHGYVTIIIVPESDESMPLPTQELISGIKENLKDKTSTYLMDLSQINLIGPGYIQVGVEASVKFTSIAEAKTIEGRIIDKLTEFFHPLHGGPEKKGWDFGRDVYISEVYEVIENTEGVDYVEELSLNASVQTYKFILKDDIKPSVSYPAGSSVVSADKKIKLSLAEKLSQRTNTGTLTAVGFKEGDCVDLIHDGRKKSFVLKSVSRAEFGDIIECEPVSTDYAYPAGSTVETRDKRIKSFILNEIPANSYISLLKIAVLEAGNKIYLSLKENAAADSAEIKEISDRVETIFIEENYLVYSGMHAVNKNKSTGLVFPYLANTNTKEIHDLNNKKQNCQLAEILNEHRKFMTTLDSIDGYDYCRWCFGADMSTR